jgi:aspartyl-tRNA(Asn)/glutamyl-tRNA(Gln) amidotransferase subunit B
VPALRAAIALGCTIQPVSRFDRKHYFYHDQPAGYQITQYYEPFAKDGELVLTADDGLSSGHVTIGIKQVQMEQDTARTQEQDGVNMADYNRAGLPLIEIISLPQIHSPEEAASYVKKVQALLFSVGAVATGMEMGGLRADVNVSVRRKKGEPGQYSYSGVQGLGQRTEIKNLSTFKGVEDAVKAERDRQISVLEAGGVIEGETRGWSLNKPGETRRLRGKEGEVDYRYLPDADIPPVRISPQVVQHITSTLPKRPDDLLAMLTDEQGYGLTTTDAKILLSIDSGERLEFFQEIVEELNSMQDLAHLTPTATPNLGRSVANWVLQELGSLLATAERPWGEKKVSSSDMAQLIHLLLVGKITSSTAKQVLKMAFYGDSRGIETIVREDNLEFQPLSDNEYLRLAAEVIETNPGPVKDIREKGKSGKLMFLVGQMMKRGKDGRVEAQKAEGVLRKLVMAP